MSCRVAKVIFDEGPLGFAIKDHNAPIKVYKRTSSLHEQLAGDHCFRKGILREEDTIEMINGVDVTRMKWNDVKELIQDSKRPMTVTFMRSPKNLVGDESYRVVDFTKKSKKEDVVLSISHKPALQYSDYEATLPLLKRILPQCNVPNDMTSDFFKGWALRHVTFCDDEKKSCVNFIDPEGRTFKSFETVLRVFNTWKLQRNNINTSSKEYIKSVINESFIDHSSRRQIDASVLQANQHEKYLPALLAAKNKEEQRTKEKKEFQKISTAAKNNKRKRANKAENIDLSVPLSNNRMEKKTSSAVKIPEITKSPSNNNQKKQKKQKQPKKKDKKKVSEDLKIMYTKLTGKRLGQGKRLAHVKQYLDAQAKSKENVLATEVDENKLSESSGESSSSVNGKKTKDLEKKRKVSSSSRSSSSSSSSTEYDNEEKKSDTLSEDATLSENDENLEEKEEELLNYGEMTVRPETFEKLVGSSTVPSPDKSFSRKRKMVESEDDETPLKKKVPSTKKKKKKKISSSKKKRRKKQKKKGEEEEEIKIDQHLTIKTPQSLQKKKKRRNIFTSSSKKKRRKKKKEEEEEIKIGENLTIKTPQSFFQKKKNTSECPISKNSTLTLPSLVDKFVQCYDTQRDTVLHAFIATSGHIRGTCNYLSQIVLHTDCVHCGKDARDVPVWSPEDDKVLLTSGKVVTKKFRREVKKKISEIVVRYGSVDVVESRINFLEGF